MESSVRADVGFTLTMGHAWTWEFTIASGYSHPIKSKVIITTWTGRYQSGDSITISLGNSDGDSKLLNLNGQIGRTSNLGKEKASVRKTQVAFVHRHISLQTKFHPKIAETEINRRRNDKICFIYMLNVTFKNSLKLDCVSTLPKRKYPRVF